jgi:ribosomal protein S20
MKKAFFLFAAGLLIYTSMPAQDQLRADVIKLDNANTGSDYQELANDFIRIADFKKTDWLPYYYAAFCNAKIGWLKQDDPDNIEPFADKADEQIKKAQSLLDTASQKKELAELYCIKSMINRARVFINPMTYGRKYGPAASQYTKLARKLNPDNPRALYLEGWEKYATPKMWGGDKQKAKELLQEAKQKLDNNSASVNDIHWGRKEVEDLLRESGKS